ncbi:MAG: hypothetical protein JNK16_06590 [Phycisphaerales bacterium]|nr:hypothetical protein [Phycisphaerales bacterium]
MKIVRGWNQIAALAGVMCLLGGPGAAFAQNSGKMPKNGAPASAAPSSPGSAPTIGAVRFNEKPLRVETMGLTMSLPTGASASSTAIGNQAAVQVTGPDSKWMSGARVLESSDLNLTLQQVADTNLKTQLGADTVMVGMEGPSGAQLIERSQNLVIGTLPAERFYVLGPKETDPKHAGRPRLIYGVTFIKLAAGRFACFESSCGEADLDRAKPEMEAMIATASFIDSASLESSRRALLDAGDQFLKGLDESALRSAALEAKETWWRLYVPAKTGADSDAKEVGYRRIRTSIGMRGQVDPSRDPKKFTGADLDEGILVQVDFRGVLGETNDALTDSQGIFFQKFDRKDEMWSLSTRVRQGKNDRTSTELGTRKGNQLTVKRTDRPATTLIVPERAYLSRVESFLVQRMLIGARLTTEFGFNTYSSESDMIEIRREMVEQPPDKPKFYRVTTRMSNGSPAQVAMCRENGDLLFADLPGGVKVEPTTLDRLVKMWKEKGLPLD